MSGKSTWIAVGLVALIGGWLASGQLGPEEASAPAPEARKGPEPVLVQAADSSARRVERFVTVQGDADSFRNTAIRSRAEGYVARIATSQGARVAKGDPILALDPAERTSRLEEARARLEQARDEYEAGEALKRRGVVSEQALGQRRTVLEAARAEVARIEREIADTDIAAPFDGVIESVAVELGEVVREGEEVARLVDLSPLRVNVQVSQKDIGRVERGSPAFVTFATGTQEWGRVCFVSRLADPSTRTFRVEVRTANAEESVPSGVGAEVRIPVGAVEAHLVSPAILSMGEDGRLGVKTVDDANAVEFHGVDVVQAAADGLWVTGLPGAARIVTLGQGFVQRGETVRVEPDDGGAGPESEAPTAETSADAPGSEICDLDPGDVSVAAGRPARSVLR